MPDLAYWRKPGDKRVMRKISLLLDSIRKDYQNGLGQPEKLKGNFTGCWSRRINKKDRIIYYVSHDDNTVYILSLRGHYLEK